MINYKSLNELNNLYLNDISSNMLKIEISMIDLFTMLHLENIEYELAYDISDVNIYVYTPSGWQLINALIRKHTTAARYILDNNEDLVCSTKHLVFENNVCKTINTCTYIDTIYGPRSIIGSEYLNDIDLYDIAIIYPHVYITTNGILHHNTTLSKCLLNELGVHSSDIRFVNGSHTNGVDDMRDLSRFAETMPSGDFRYVVIDESDFLSPNAQAALRNMIEEYTSICRWILTCNFENKIIPALKSRTQGFRIESLDKELFLSRIANILMSENIELTEENLEILDEYVTATYPDLRKCTNLLQQNCINNTLTRPSNESSNSSSDYMVNVVNLFKNGKIHEARKIICANIRQEEYEELYKLLYRNLEWWGNDDTQQNQAIVIIANRLRDHAICADSELNLAACLVELAMI